MSPQLVMTKLAITPGDVLLEIAMNLDSRLDLLSLCLVVSIS